MANFDSDLIVKNIRHRGIANGKEQTVSGRVRVKAGGSIATSDLLRMVPLGENQRPIRMVAMIRAASNVTRPDGTVFTPVTTSATRLGASTALSTDEMAHFTEIDSVTDSVNWGPFYVTMTPSGAGAFSVAGGDVDVTLEVVYLGEAQTAEPVYTRFNNPKYKN